MGLPWRAVTADLDETAYLIEPPLIGGVNVAVAKAHDVKTADAEEVVVAADTLVVTDGQILGKPADADEAQRMLERLRARDHHVMTGVALVGLGREWAGVVDTLVTMRGYSDEEVEAYIARGEPFDKAGGYAIQDEEFRPVARIEGCYLNVVGLPLCTAAAGLATLGIEVDRAQYFERSMCAQCGFSCWYAPR